MATNNFSRILLRKGKTDELTSINPFLKKGEPIVEYDTGRMKIGDGTNRWNDLPYVDDNDDSEIISDIESLQYYGDKNILIPYNKLNLNI